MEILLGKLIFENEEIENCLFALLCFNKVKGGLDTDIILDGFIRYFPESFSTFTLSVNEEGFIPLKLLNILRSEAECSLFKRLPKNYKPTHVVTAVSYGADAHIVFSKVGSFSRISKS